MVRECAFLYEPARHCRRIPRRGETLCPAHRNAPADPGPDPAMFAFAESLEFRSVPELLASAIDSLSALVPLFERRFARRRHSDFMRATLAVECALARLEEVPLPSLAPPRIAPAAPAAGPMPSIEDLERICDKLLKATDSQAHPPAL